ncbi:hypothetical protein GCM10007385_31090 [Tateyamaria omphalii]|nr:hypothetical protein GCM10007385_31090 [Tateyamaria omphalii]
MHTDAPDGVSTTNGAVTVQSIFESGASWRIFISGLIALDHKGTWFADRAGDAQVEPHVQRTIGIIRKYSPFNR